MIYLYYNYEHNFLWTVVEDDQTFSWSYPKSRRIGKFQARNPLNYYNVLIGDL